MRIISQLTATKLHILTRHCATKMPLSGSFATFRIRSSLSPVELPALSNNSCLIFPIYETSCLPLPSQNPTTCSLSNRESAKRSSSPQIHPLRFTLASLLWANKTFPDIADGKVRCQSSTHLVLVVRNICSYLKLNLYYLNICEHLFRKYQFLD